MTKEERLKLNIAIENLVQKVKKVQKAHPELLLGEPTKVTLKVLGFRLRASLRSQLPAFVIYYLCVSVVT